MMPTSLRICNLAKLHVVGALGALVLVGCGSNVTESLSTKPDASVPDSSSAPGASVLDSSSTKAELRGLGGGYRGGVPLPAGAPCDNQLWTFTLDLVAKGLAWDFCDVVGDWSTASHYTPLAGSRTLSGSEFESARTALSAVYVSEENACSFDKETLVLTMTSAAGSQVYHDDFYSCGRPNPPYVESQGLDNLWFVLGTLAKSH